MPTREELIANGRSVQEIAQELGADGVVFQNLDDLITAIQRLNPDLQRFDASCFTGEYLTQDIDEAYLLRLSKNKKSA